MRMKTMRRVKSGLMAMVLGVSMMTAAPVDVKAAVPAIPCQCGATMTYKGYIDRCVYKNESHHQVVRDHYYHCKYGDVKCISEPVGEAEAHTRSKYEDLGHYTYPDELFGDHTYKLKCVCGKEFETVSIICHYPGANSHNTPY